MPLAYPITRSLFLVAQPEYLSTSDMVIIRDRVMELGPDVRAMVVGRADRPELVSADWWRRPTLTVSFGPLGKFRPLRGAVLYNRAISKLEQYSLMIRSGIQTPLTAAFHFGMQISEEEWGEFCVLKPANLNASSSGRGLYLYRTRRLAELRAEDLPKDHLALSQPMIVQSFVDTGSRFKVYRSLTLFGEVVYQNVAEAPEERPALGSANEVIESVLPEPPRHLTAPVINVEGDIMAFASTVSRAFPDTPLLGCDIVREVHSGKLYAIEVNAGGNVWHLSSPRTSASRTITKIQTYLETFKSYDRAAQALIRAVRHRAN